MRDPELRLVRTPASISAPRQRPYNIESLVEETVNEMARRSREQNEMERIER